MSNDLKNKMYNYEVNPPDTSWEYIAHFLDEHSIQKNISEKLYPYEIAPPANAWSNIVNAIDLELSETNFRNKALSLEVQPPSFAWNKIAEELDAQPLNNFSKRMYEYQADPPVNSWKKIIAVLDEEQTTAPVVPIQRNYSRVYRIAAAAAIIGIITWAGFSLFSNTKDNNENNSIANENPKTVAPVTPVAKTKENNVSDAIKTEITSSVAAISNPAAQITSTRSFSKKRPGITSKNPGGQTHDLAASEIHSGSDDITIADAESLHTKKESVTGNTENTTEARYLVYLTEQGDIVKLSKKLVDLKCIYTKEGNVNQDALSKLDASQCIDQVKYWQEKMANSSLQSSSNPLELIEILK
jgi:hypothetical protein